MKQVGLYIFQCVNGEEKNLTNGLNLLLILGELPWISKTFGTHSCLTFKVKLDFLNMQDLVHGMILICLK